MPRNNYAYSEKLKPYANANRRNPTPQERQLWFRFLSRYPVKFYRQRMIGVYIADFYCAAAKLIIELDGGQHDTEQGKASDRNRTAALGEMFIEVIRFSNDQVDHHFSDVCRAIDIAVKRRIRETPSKVSPGRGEPPVRLRLTAPCKGGRAAAREKCEVSQNPSGPQAVPLSRGMSAKPTGG